MHQAERELRQSELGPFILALARTFVRRWDLHARQLDDGRYICIHKPLNADHLVAHLNGEITLGAYLLDQGSQARFVVLDADDAPAWGNLRKLAADLESEGIPAYLECSRRGGHLWLFFAASVSAREARAFGLGLLAAHGLEEVELFPKQDVLGAGPGSLIRLPFGIHRLTGRRYTFLTPAGKRLAPTIREQVRRLGSPRKVPEAGFEAYQSFAPSPSPPLPPTLSELAPSSLSEGIKRSISVLEFVSQYVELNERGVGRCPFHDDHHPSFAVDDEGNYWNCFAGCGGGSIVDFWMKWRGCDFTAAVRELAGMLL